MKIILCLFVVHDLQKLTLKRRRRRLSLRQLLLPRHDRHKLTHRCYTTVSDLLKTPKLGWVLHDFNVNGKVLLLLGKSRSLFAACFFRRWEGKRIELIMLS